MTPAHDDDQGAELACWQVERPLADFLIDCALIAGAVFGLAALALWRFT